MHGLTLKKKEKNDIMNLLFLIESTITDCDSEDFGRYVTLGLRLDPDNPDMLGRNESQ